ncbi:hypothetical protein Desaf_0316 [Desulfocurvibacter africanus subsp. africanus str. Walvis Bay]|uniref:Uncharacterized protein n=1 Tax=Desulfocurvibacter africanus subsp. africanus str. Walvis Bay TaxID=690850 RepID=F3YU67_DESAF|nr:hypothetical protein Desaf_0316 [Desulfocurvibacter africanus subsp. africanus str. Walvis Bay]
MGAQGQQGQQAGCKDVLNDYNATSRPTRALDALSAKSMRESPFLTGRKIKQAATLDGVAACFHF